MSQQRLIRQRERNQRAYERARARKAADPFERARARCRELNLPASCALFVDAVGEHHAEIGKANKLHVAYVGYGDGTPAERHARRPNAGAQQPRQPARFPSLSERTGLSRRTLMRARKLLEGHDVLHCRRAGEVRERTYPAGWRRGDQDRWAAGQVRRHLVGVGGVERGGGGRANAYWPDGVEPPPPELPPRRPPTPEGRPDTTGRAGEIWRRHQEQREAERRGRPQETRGP